MFNQSLICQQIFGLWLWPRELEVVMKISVEGSKTILLFITPSSFLPLRGDAH